MTEQEILTDHEQRIKKIESDYSRDIGQILNILKLVEQRLVGSIDDDSKPGLLSEHRQLKRDHNDLKTHLKAIELDIGEIKKSINPALEISEKVGKLDEKINKVRTYGLVAYGGMVVILWILSRVDLSTIIK